MNARSLDRRQFVAAAGGSLAAAALVDSHTTAAPAAAPVATPIVDTHQHLWDLKKFSLPWLGSAPELFRKTYMTAEYAEATQGLNIQKAVYMEVDVAPAQQVAEAEQLIEICRSRQGATVAAVVSGRPSSDGFESYLRRFQNSPYIKGVRQVLHVPETPAGACLTSGYVRGVRLLGELGKSFDLCMRPMELGDGVKLADLCPDTRFVVDHCGNADPHAFRKTPAAGAEKPWHELEPWKRSIGELAKRKNVICKISGVVARAPERWTSDDLAPIVNFCLDEFGPDRVVFGSDWPVCLLRASYRQWVESLQQIVANRPAEAQRKLFHDNAVKFYGLE